MLPMRENTGGVWFQSTHFSALAPLSCKSTPPVKEYSLAKTVNTVWLAEDNDGETAYLIFSHSKLFNNYSREAKLSFSPSKRNALTYNMVAPAMTNKTGKFT